MLTVYLPCCRTILGYIPGKQMCLAWVHSHHHIAQRHSAMHLCLTLLCACLQESFMVSYVVAAYFFSGGAGAGTYAPGCCAMLCAKHLSSLLPICRHAD